MPDCEHFVTIEPEAIGMLAVQYKPEPMFPLNLSTSSGGYMCVGKPRVPHQG
jgi:hypothetical protein